jgi:5S rRNA maturation endonuclease (ribonuclease M5)
MKKWDTEELLDILEELSERLVIVEGKKDEKALKSLGLKDIIAINGRPLYKIADIALSTDKEIVILTDFDKKGRQIENKLKELLHRQNKKINSKLRWKVMALGKNKIEDFGRIDSGSHTSLREVDAYVKTCAYFDKIPDKGGNRCTRSNRKT